MTVSEKHREQAWAIYFNRCDEVDRLAPQFEEEEVIDLLARALAAAEREGMMREAEIARGSAGEFDFQTALAEGRDFDYGFYNGKNHAADSIRAAILSQAGEA